MNNFCTDIGWRSLNKYGERLCGDRVETVDSDSPVIVLADGLGSGVKANILSTLTARIISTMISQNMSLQKCVSTIAATLPVCPVRRIAYSTFTIMKISGNPNAPDEMEAEIIQYDNPHVVMLRGGRNFEYPRATEKMDGKTIYKSKIKLQENDVLVAMSDGVIHAGMGTRLSFGWQRENAAGFLEGKYKDEYTAKTLATILTDEAALLYDDKPGDDATAAVARIRRRKPVNLLIGPPANADDDEKMMSLFFSKEGRHIVCGGTTSSIAAKFLESELRVSPGGYVVPDIPPIAEIEGVDLATEGVITINRVLEYSRDYIGDNSRYSEWRRGTDGASRVAVMLFEEATDINFFVGRAINAAHQNPSLPIRFSIKMSLVEELSESLKNMGKRIKVSYF
ncbi:MAG: serine/threonine-protein phosphatase [Synergistaceae bacterium]|jgi:hypothetical protein|nr:serine/threonine-protein phosphatase [Synergistaceae bacterium]